MKQTDTRGLENTSPYRVLIVDDHSLLREGLKQLINNEKDLEVCGEAWDIASALEAMEKLSPDLAVVDISLGEQSGIELVKDIRVRNRDMKILIVSMHDELIYAGRALRAGADGYLMKREPAESVLHAIRRVLAGKIYLSENMQDRFLRKSLMRTTDPEMSFVDLLSDRELEVFQKIGSGLKPGEIARVMTISVKTVESYISRIKDKLEMESASDLTRFAVHWNQSN